MDKHCNYQTTRLEIHTRTMWMFVCWIFVLSGLCIHAQDTTEATLLRTEIYNCGRTDLSNCHTNSEVLNNAEATETIVPMELYENSSGWSSNEPEDNEPEAEDNVTTPSPKRCYGEVLNNGSSLLYPFGCILGDVSSSRSDQSDKMNLLQDFPFGNKKYNHIWIGTCGFVSFSNIWSSVPISLACRETASLRLTLERRHNQTFAIVAPFMSTTISTYCPKRELLYRVSRDTTLLTRATSDVRRAYISTNQHQSFNAETLIIVTWSNVGIGLSCRARATFQLVLVTDGRRSFSIQTYSNIDRLDFRTSQDLMVGFFYDESHYYMLPISNTPAIEDIEHTSNCGINGRYVFRLDRNDEKTNETCQDYLCEENQVFDTTVGRCISVDSTFPSISRCGVKLHGPVVEDDLYVMFYCEANLTTKHPSARARVSFLFDGHEDVGVPDSIISAKSNRAALHEQYLWGKIPTTISCKVATYWEDNPHNLSPSAISNAYWAGLWTSTTTVSLNEADDTPSPVHVYSTLPVTCSSKDASGQLEGCTLELEISSSEGVAVFIKDAAGGISRCSYSLHPEDWDEGQKRTHNQYKPLMFVAMRQPFRDHYKTGQVSFSIKEKYSIKEDKQGQRYYSPWHGAAISDIKIYRTHNNGAQCISSGDPRMTTFDRSYYSAGQTGFFVLARSTSVRGFEVHVRHWACSQRSSGCSVACAVAVQEGQYAYGIDVCNPDLIVHRLVLSNYFVDYDPITTDGSRRHWKITMPSGASVSVYVFKWSRGGLNVYVNVLPRDAGKTEGLCGTFDGRRENDFKMSNGETAEVGRHYWNDYRKINDFIESWRLVPEESLFYKPPEFLSEDDEYDSLQACSCQTPINDYVACGFDALQDPIYKAGQPSIPVSVLQPSWIANSINRRNKRSNGQRVHSFEIDDTYEIIDYGNETTNVLPEDLEWPTANGITEDEANTHCELTINSSVAHDSCADVISQEDTQAIINKCVSDIKSTGDKSWAFDKVAELQSKCMHDMVEIDSFESNSPENITTRVKRIVATLCPEDCSKNGTCEDGTCKCDSGYIGADCSLSVGVAPVIDRLLQTPRCDIQERPCSNVRVLASAIASSPNLTCNVQTVRHMEDGQYTTVNHTDPGFMISSTEVECKLPTLTKGHISSLPAYHYVASISNDGLVFSDTSPDSLLVFDSKCVTCDNSRSCIYQGVGCLISGLCYDECDRNPEDDTKQCKPSQHNRQWSVSSVDCGWSDQFVDGDCSKPCDFGLQSCRRHCLVENCIGESILQCLCNEFNCPEAAIETKEGLILVLHDVNPGQVALLEAKIWKLTSDIIRESCASSEDDWCVHFDHRQSGDPQVNMTVLVSTAKGYPSQHDQDTWLKILVQVPDSKRIQHPGEYMPKQALQKIVEPRLQDYSKLLGRGVSIHEEAQFDVRVLLIVVCVVLVAMLILLVIGLALIIKRKKSSPYNVEG